MHSYRRSRQASYARHGRISPSLHLHFRENWDAGIDEALKRAAKLQRKGWRIDLKRGALTKSQASRIAQRLDSEAEVELIPVTEWMGEEIVLIAYKEKPKPKHHVEKAEKQASVANPLSKEELFERFKKICLRGEEPSATYLSEGMIMDDFRVIAAVAEDSTSSLAKQRDTLEKDVSTLVYAGRADKKLIQALKEAERQGYQNVRVGPTVVRIENLLKALRVLKGAELVMRAKEDTPLWLIQRQNKNSIVIAPVIKPYDETVTKNFSEVLAKAER